MRKRKCVWKDSWVDWSAHCTCLGHCTHQVGLHCNTLHPHTALYTALCTTLQYTALNSEQCKALQCTTFVNCALQTANFTQHATLHCALHCTVHCALQTTQHTLHCTTLNIHMPINSQSFWLKAAPPSIQIYGKVHFLMSQIDSKLGCIAVYINPIH